MDEKNQVTVKISGDAAEVNKLIERLQNQNPEIKIKLNTTDAEKKMNALGKTSFGSVFLKEIKDLSVSAVDALSKVTEKLTLLNGFKTALGEGKLTERFCPLWQ